MENQNSLVEPVEQKKKYVTYKLKIGVTKNGQLVRGSKAIKENENNLSEVKEIYRSQEKYQVAVLNKNKKWTISNARNVKKTFKGKKLMKKFV